MKHKKPGNRAFYVCDIPPVGVTILVEVRKSRVHADFAVRKYSERICKRLVQMLTFWKHRQTGIYYLYEELPPQLRSEMGRCQVRRSLKTRDPAEASR